ncbi:MAG TPA: PAS domain S-box protein [Candidatus Competibacteraceae bacterium]|nr:PAS domain S-box protein [Candidatus Competibacteraceae bacterium]
MSKPAIVLTLSRLKSLLSRPALLLGLAFLALSILLTWQRYEEVKSHERELVAGLTYGVGRQLDMMLHERSRSIAIIAQQEVTLLGTLEERHAMQADQEQLEELLRASLPHAVAYLISDAEGRPRAWHCYGLGATGCQAFQQAAERHVLVAETHLELMPELVLLEISVPWKLNGERSGWLTIGFLPQLLIQPMQQPLRPGYALWLGQRDRPGEVLLTAQGLTGGWRPPPGYRVFTGHRVEGSMLMLQAVVEPFTLPMLLRRAFNEVAPLLSAALSAGLLALWFLRREYRRRQQAQASLRQSEAQLHSLLDTAQEGVGMLDALGYITYANQRLHELLGFTPGELVGQRYLVLLAEEEWPRAEAAFNRRRSGISDQQEFILRRRDGARLWALIASNPIRDEQARFRGVLCMVSDITLLKQSEAALRQSEQRFRDFAEIAADMFWELDENLRFTYVSGQHQSRLGLPSAQILDRPLEAFLADYHELGRAPWPEYLARVRQHQPFSGLEIAWSRRSGERLYLSISGKPVFDENGRFRGYRGCSSDITVRKQAEQELRRAHGELEARVRERTAELVRSNTRLQQEIQARLGAVRALREREERFRQLAEHIREVFWMVSLDQRQRIYISPAYEEVWGRSSEEWRLGRSSFLDTVHPLDRAKVAQVIAASRESGRMDVEYRILRPDGGIRWIHDRGFPVYDAQGRLYRMAGIAEDITARRQAQDQLRQLREELTHMGRLSLAGEMASGLAHEINQPLAAMVTYAQAALRLLKSESVEREQLATILEKVAEQGLRAGGIIHRLRKFLRKQPPQRSATDLNQLIRELDDLYRAEYRRFEVSVELELDEALPRVLADGIQIQQVLLNLMRNAMEAMQEVPEGQRQLTVRTRAAGVHSVEVLLRDSGPGLSAEARSHLFQPFFTTKAEGMGLGLSISRSIIEAHGGTLAAESDPRGGTVFRFTLPVAEEQAAAAAEAEAEEQRATALALPDVRRAGGE